MSSWIPMARREGGTVAAVALSPNFVEDQLAFAATPTGAFRSFDGGRSWELGSEGMTSTIVQCVGFSPGFASDHTLFAGTADGRVFRSTDGGDSWSLLTTLEGASAVISLVVAPGYADTGVVLAGTLAHGVFHSEDRGEKWEARNTGIEDLSVMAMALSPDFERDAIGFVAAGSKLYRTGDGGKSWKEVYAGTEDDAPQVIAVSPNFPADRTVFLGTERQGVLRSSDGGDTWQQAGTGLPDLSVNAVALSPDFGKNRVVLVATGQGIARSEDGGESWRTVGAQAKTALSLDIAPGGEVVLAGLLNHGVLRSVDGGRSWESTNRGLVALSLTGLALSPAFSSDETLFLWGSSEGVFRSEDGGRSYLPASTGLDATVMSALVLSPSFAADGTLYAGTSAGLFRSQDRAATWHSVGLADQEVGLLALSPAFGQDRIMAAASDSGLSLSRDGGESWEKIDGPTSGEALTSLALVAKASGELVLLAGTWREPEGERRGRTRVWMHLLSQPYWWVLFTANAETGIIVLGLPDSYPKNEFFFIGSGSSVYRIVPGARERTRDGILPLWVPGKLGSKGFPVVSLAPTPDFARTRTLFAAAHDGIFVSRNDGATWQRMAEDLGGCAPIAVAPSPRFPEDGVVYALAVGGQIWRLERE